MLASHRTPDVLGHLVAVIRRRSEFHVFPDDLLGAEPVEPLGRGVPALDQTIGRDAEDRIVGRLHDRCEPAFGDRRPVPLGIDRGGRRVDLAPEPFLGSIDVVHPPLPLREATQGYGYRTSREEPSPVASLGSER